MSSGGGGGGKPTPGGKADYDMIKELGRGSFGVVHKVRRKKDRKICVQKQVSMRHFKTEKQKTQALNEAKIMKQLNSAHIVEYLDAFVEKEFLYIVIQFCEGGDLKTHLANVKNMAERSVWRVFLRTTLGLEYLHSRRILHRDLKSENLFLTGDDGVRIGDLGLAKMLTNTATGASTLCGTPRYLSPEEVIGSSHYNEKSDVWALGVILYELCSEGHRGPFDEATRIPALLQKIVNEEPPPLRKKGLDECLRETVGKLLDKNALQRPSITEILALPYVPEKAEKNGVFELQGREIGGMGGSLPTVLSTVSSRAPSTYMSGASVPGSMNPASMNPAGGLSVVSETHMSMNRTYAGSVPDGICSRICKIFGMTAVEADLGQRFHRVGNCEICVAQGKEDSGFTMMRSRHHCRVCGRSVCSEHSTGKRKLEHLGYKKEQRICEICSLLPSNEPVRSTRPLVIASDNKTHAWDSTSLNAPSWTVGEMLCWVGQARIAPGAPDIFCTLESHSGAVLEMRSLQYGEVVNRMPIPGMPVGADADGRSAAPLAQGVRPVKKPISQKNVTAAAKLPAGPLVDIGACCGRWFACVTVESKDKPVPASLTVMELPDGRSLKSSEVGRILGTMVSKKPITALALQSSSSKDGFVVTGGDDGQVRVWGVPMEDAVCDLMINLSGHKSKIMSIGIGANANFICTGSTDAAVRLWRKGASGFQANQNLEQCDDYKASGECSVCCDAHYLCFVQVPRLGQWEQGASLWDLALGKWERSFFKRGHSVNCVALRGVVLATAAAPTTNRGCTVQLWHAPTGTALSTISNPAPVSRLLLADITQGSHMMSSEIADDSNP